MATDLVLASTDQKQLTPMDLLSVALSRDAAIDVIERITNLCREEREYQSRVSFDDALSRCQAKLRRISADADNSQSHSRYATYAKLDKVVRPIYTAEGFSVSFGERDCPTPGKTRFVAYLSRGGVTREYLKDMTPSTKGPKGNDVMTPLHADAAVDSYAKRYLLKDIFNIAIGEDDTDGNGAHAAIEDERFVQLMDNIQNAGNLEELKNSYFAANREADSTGDKRAQSEFSKAKNQRYRELVKANAAN